MTFRIPEPQAPVYRDAAPPPGVEIHRGRTDEGIFVVTVHTVDGEIDGEFLAAILAYVARVNERRGRRPKLTLVSSQRSAG